ncbi:MAG: 3D domain-containing protein [Bacilli bacterium]|nr:3D domain-containing protein [Bacilli bacterium]
MKNKKRKRTISYILNLSVVPVFCALFLLLIASSMTVTSTKTYDISRNRSLKAVNLVSKYKTPTVEIKKVDSFTEALKSAKTNPTTFNGKMTGYGPDCKGCGGGVSCIRYNVRNGNIYYNDKDYGKIRILAADKKIPCGTVIRVSNLRKYKDFYAIVLDRGGAIKGNLMDLLFVSESSVDIGRENVKYTVVRWGWNA